MTTSPEAVEEVPAIADLRPSRRPWAMIAAGAAVLAVFLMTAIALAETKMPWADEGWFANPAYNLAFRGNMGTNVLEPSGHYLNAYLSGIQQRTYIVPPLYLLNLAGWYRLFGFSLLSTRTLSLFWACVGLAALFSVVRSLTRSSLLALLSAALTSLDIQFLWGAVDGRMDMMCSALGLTAIAVYLLLRDKRLSVAILSSHILLAAALFTHPNAMAAIVLLLYLTLVLDRARLRAYYVLLAGAPYLAFLLAWLPYIFQSPSDFRAQFLANAAGPGSARLIMLQKPWLLIIGEMNKYFEAYDTSLLWPGHLNQWAKFIPVIFVIALAICISRRKIALNASSHLLLGAALVYWTAVTVLIGFKPPNYLVLSLPWHGAILALALLSLWRSHASNRLLAAFMGVTFVLIQATAIFEKIERDDYHRQYLPIAKIVRQAAAEHLQVDASAAFGFDVPFEQLRDDVRLGIYSGIHPDVVVVEPLYAFWYDRLAKKEPSVLAYTSELLHSLRLVRHQELIDVYEVNSGPKIVP